MSHSARTNNEASTSSGLNANLDNLPNVHNLTNSSITQAKSYATATMNNSLPSKEQAILIDAIDNIPMKDYIYAVAKVTGPEAIHFASRIANGRICIYLNRKTTAQDFVTNHRTIIINNVHTTVRSLINPSQRIILSNVSPSSIQHEYIEKFFTHNNVRMTSKLTFLRAGIYETGFTHIMSFRKQSSSTQMTSQKFPNLS